MFVLDSLPSHGHFSRLSEPLQVCSAESRESRLWGGPENKSMRWTTFFSYRSSRESYSIEIKIMSTHHNGQAEAETQAEGPQPFCAAAYNQMYLSRSSRAVQTFSCREICKSSRDLRKEGDIMSANVPILTNFLSRYTRKSLIWEVTSSQRDIDAWYHAMTRADWQPCPKSMQGEEAKQASNSEEKNSKNIQGEGD